MKNLTLLWLAYGGLILSALALSWWSFALVDPNLTLLNQAWFVQWQTQRWMWGGNSVQVVQYYLVTLMLWVMSYAGVVYSWRRWPKLFSLQTSVFVLGIIGIILFIGQNALSHDIFNYLFNAKMVWVYQGNPHQQVALDFPQDDWIRFMHNVHTPAPYGWLWTGLSLIPFSLSGGKFLLALLAMKLFMVVGLVWFLWALWRLIHSLYPSESGWRWGLVAFHPLLLIETILNGHNDVWMMAPVLTIISLVQQRKHFSFSGKLLILILWTFSIGIKFATLLLAPLILYWILGDSQKWWEKALAFFPSSWRLQQIVPTFWPELCSVLLLIPLLTPRSQQFHPWYFIWILPFLPVIRWQWWRAALLGLSLASLWRYSPWLTAQLQYSPAILSEMKFITWSGALLGIAVYGALISWQRLKSQ